MSLIKLSADRDRGYGNVPVYVETTQIVLIHDIIDRYGNTKNQTRISLTTGDKVDVIESSHVVYNLCKPEEPPQAR